jgi:hypothetical protein
MSPRQTADGDRQAETGWTPPLGVSVNTETKAEAEAEAVSMPAKLLQNPLP